MRTPEAEQYVGRSCMVSWTDKLGQVHNKILHVEDLQYVPLYGAYVVDDDEYSSLDSTAQSQAA